MGSCILGGEVATGPGLQGGMFVQPEHRGSGLDAWSRLAEWEDEAPRGDAGSAPVDSESARIRLEKLLPMGGASVRIHLNPQDFEMIKALRERHEETWRILEDETLLPGGCKVESELSRIDATVETRLALALKQLFEHQREQLGHPLEADLHTDLSKAKARDDAP